MITIKQLISIGVSSANALKYYEALNDTMLKYCINTPMRKAHFMAQLLHETGMLIWVKELASGADYDTGRKAVSLGNTPEDDGDGEKYKGRGGFQVTGKFNYKAISKDLGVDFLTSPELLEKPKYAMLSAGWFWDKNNLNALADKDGLTAITKRINGGTNGFDHRLELLGKCKKAIALG